MAIEIVDLSMKHGDFPQLFVCLPEGSSYNGDILWYFIGRTKKQIEPKMGCKWDIVHWHYGNLVVSENRAPLNQSTGWSFLLNLANLLGGLLNVT